MHLQSCSRMEEEGGGFLGGKRGKGKRSDRVYTSMSKDGTDGPQILPYAVQVDGGTVHHYDADPMKWTVRYRTITMANGLTN